MLPETHETEFSYAQTHNHTQHIKGHRRWQTLPLTPKEDMSYPAACLSIPPSSNPLCQTATEQIIQSVSSPWWPDLSHTRTLPGCGSEEIETFIGFLRRSEPTTDMLFWVLIRTVNMNGAHVHICGAFRHHEAQTTLESTLPFFSVWICILQRPVNTLVVYFWSAFVFRGICFQDIDASSTFSNHPFERRPSLPFALPPALNNAVCPQKQTTPSPWEGEACWAIGEMRPRKLEKKKWNKKVAFFLSSSHLSRQPLTTTLTAEEAEEARRHLCRIFGGAFHLMEPSRNISRYSGETWGFPECVHVFVFVDFDQTPVIQSRSLWSLPASCI